MQTLVDMGFRIESVLVRDDFNGRDGQSHWSVTIIRNGQSMHVDYSQGCAYRYHRGTTHRPYVPKYGNPTLQDVAVALQTKPTPPTLENVMYCVVMDAQCVMHGQTFEDFASELGYDEDSRSAEKCYNACRDAYFGLIRLGVSPDQLSEI